MAGCLNRRVVSSPGHEADWGVEITWHGHSCFTFRDAGGKVVVTDPFDDTVGYPVPRLYADVLLITHNHFDHNNKGAVAPLGRTLKIVSSSDTVQGAGFDLQSIEADHDDKGGTINGRTLLFVWKMGGLTIAHLGDLGQTRLTTEQKEALKDIDVLFIPVGGFVTLNGPGAYKIVRDIAPKAVFPMHYGRPEAHYYPLDPVDKFLNLFPPGQVHRFAGPTIRLSRKDLTDKTVVYVPGSFTSRNSPNKYPFFE